MEKNPQWIRPPIIDVEASGFGPSSYPIEIGFILSSGARYCSLIVPFADWTYWDEEAESVHHISREMLFANGKPVDLVADELNVLLAANTVFSDAWVVDKPWIAKLFEAAARPMTFSVSPLETILHEKQMAIWHETKNRILKIPGVVRHRASSDAWVIQETYARTRALN